MGIPIGGRLLPPGPMVDAALFQRGTQSRWGFPPEASLEKSLRISIEYLVLRYG